MNEEQYSFETKCRRCGHVSEWYAGEKKVLPYKDFERIISDFLNTPTVRDCDKCAKSTVQDLIAYSEDN
jgi:hypothetical protein